MFRKRRRPTPGFGIPPPFNPIAGDHAKLRVEGIFPYCAMMQVAAEDEYDDYVICRGFDTRILKFIDYEEGNPNKPGISVAKPFGSRGTFSYRVGQVYPALLPTQGSVDDGGAASRNYVPPSPTGVNWRLGQNPGKVAENVGHPQSLGDAITSLTDHNGKAINWLLIDGSSNASIIEFELTQPLEKTVRTATAEVVSFDQGSDPDPEDSGVEVVNPETATAEVYEFAGAVGDRGAAYLITEGDDAGKFRILRIRGSQFKPFISFGLNDVLTTGTASQSAFIVRQYGHGTNNPTEGPITVHNEPVNMGVYMFEGPASTRGLAAHDSGDNYIILQLFRDCP